MSSDPDDTDAAEFIEPAENVDAVDEVLELAKTQRSRWVDGVVVMAVLAAAVVLVSGRSRTAPTASTLPTTAPLSSAESTLGELAQNDSADFVDLEWLGDQRVLAVVSDRSGNESRLVSMTAESTEVLDLPPLHNFAFDASGRWLAATSVSRLSGVQRILWLAPVGGAFEPVAVDVRGFAWHDDAPGRVAWTTDERTAIFSLNLEEPPEGDDREELTLPIRGALRGWGTWGYSIQTSYRIAASALIDPTGNRVADDVAGVYAGRWHDGRLLFSGGGSTSTFVDAATWQTTAVPFVDADDVVLTLSASENETVVLIADRGVRSSPFNGSVVRSQDSMTGSTAAVASAYTRLAWLDDAVVFAEQDVLAEIESPNGTRMTVSRDDGQRIELPLPEIFDGRVWIAAIAVADNANR